MSTHAFRERENRSVDDEGPNNENIGRQQSTFSSSLASDTSLNSNYIRPERIHDGTEEKLRRNLKYFFMNPYEKWKAKRRFPWKLLIQFVKIILVTIQLTLFGSIHSNYVTFVERNRIALKHIFLKDWNPSYETLPYPPATGVYAIYQENTMYAHINFIMQQYYEQDTDDQLGIGAYQVFTEHNKHRHRSLIFCITELVDSQVFPNGSFIFNSKEDTRCTPIRPYNGHNGTYVYDIKRYLKQHNETISLDAMLALQINFPLRSINLKTYSKKANPRCYIFNIKIKFDNQRHDGQMLVGLFIDVESPECNGTIINAEDNKKEHTMYLAFYTIIILISLVSMMLCFRSMYRAYRTQQVVVKFFKHHYNKQLNMSDRTEFFNMWYLLIICNDILTIAGTAVLMEGNNHVPSFNTIGLLLGTGSLLTWFGTLRYIGFFKKYNVLIVTLKRASPNVLRFLVCAGIMYFGFMFCGWVVLGPYHIKFRTLLTTSECLFALINGDDMFATFSSLETQDYGIWVYSRIYLYSFISLFIYIVLSLFIAVIMDTYETIKFYYENGFPKSDLFEFIDKCSDTATSGAFRADNVSGCWNLSQCCNRPEELTSPIIARSDSNELLTP